MARANFVKKARKEVKSAGIKPGDSYWWWQFKNGPKQYSKTRPRPSQLTSSDKKSRAYAAAETLEDFAQEINDETTADEVRTRLEEIASDVQEIAQEYRDSFDNMPEGLQQGPTGQLCEENADALESWASEIEDYAGELDDDEFDPDEVQSRVGDLAGEQPL